MASDQGGLEQISEFQFFTKDEFKCKCCGQTFVSEELIHFLDQARSISGIPYVIQSGYRCPGHNSEVGSKQTSSHVKGLAVDIQAINSQERFLILFGLLMAGFNRVGIGSTFIHADIDSSKSVNVCWLY